MCNVKFSFSNHNSAYIKEELMKALFQGDL